MPAQLPRTSTAPQPAGLRASLGSAPRSVLALLSLFITETLAVFAVAVLALVVNGGSAAVSAAALILFGLACAGALWGLARASLGAHKMMVFCQTFFLVAGFSLMKALPAAGIALVALAAGTLMAGFWPSCRQWFEQSQQAAQTQPHRQPRP